MKNLIIAGIFITGLTVLNGVLFFYRDSISTGPDYNIQTIDMQANVVKPKIFIQSEKMNFIIEGDSYEESFLSKVVYFPEAKVSLLDKKGKLILEYTSKDSIMSLDKGFIISKNITDKELEYYIKITSGTLTSFPKPTQKAFIF